MKKLTLWEQHIQRAEKDRAERLAKEQQERLALYERIYTKNSAKAERHAKQKEVATKAAELKRSGKTFREIAKELGFNHHQRVQQILKQWFPGEKFPKINKGHREGSWVPFTCEQCGKTIEVRKSSVQNGKRFCEMECSVKYKQRNAELVLPADLISANRKGATIEEKRAYWKFRTNAYYHLHKNDPKFKERIRLHNKIGEERRKQKAKERRALLQVKKEHE